MAIRSKYDFHLVSFGDVIRLDNSVFQIRKEGQIIHVAQQGDQNDFHRFDQKTREEGFLDDANLSRKHFAVTGFIAQEDMRANRDLRDVGEDSLFGQFFAEEVEGDVKTGFGFKENGLVIAFNQGPQDSRGGFEVFEHTFNFPRPRVATVQIETKKTIVKTTPT